MSRNKVILIVGAIIALYVALPSEGIYLVIKSNMLAIAPYIMIGLIVYLIVVIQLLKKALYKLSENLIEENVFPVSRLLRIAFDVKRMVGTVNLVNVYKKVNSNKKISYEAKNSLYEALKRKRIEIAPPSGVPIGGR